MILSQARVLTRKTGIKPIALIDDYHAELDKDVCNRLLILLLDEKVQCFLTSTQNDLTGLDVSHYKLFHVEQGQISETNHQQLIKYQT